MYVKMYHAHEDKNEFVRNGIIPVLWRKRHKTRRPLNLEGRAMMASWPQTSYGCASVWGCAECETASSGFSSPCIWSPFGGRSGQIWGRA